MLCDRHTLASLVAIELDDSTRDSPMRQARDALVDEACRTAGLPILHFRGQQDFDRRALEQTLQCAVSQARASGASTEGILSVGSNDPKGSASLKVLCCSLT